MKRFVLLLPVLLLACGDRGREAASGESEQLALATQEDPWVTIDGVDFPARMEGAPPEVQEAYVFAAKHPEVLQYMPCYCGCEQESPPHHSNVDCFVDQIDRTGPRPRVTVDGMGFG